VKNIENDIPDLEVLGDSDSEYLIAGWGGTFGAITEAVNRLRQRGVKLAQVHFRYLNPFPKNTGTILKNYKKILCPELNMGQLSKILKSEFLADVEPFNKIQGLPFKSSEIESKIESMIGVKNNGRE
jgi:2-oxoglutarate ferredoxin oxidoreductase subunit alpha